MGLNPNSWHPDIILGRKYLKLANNLAYYDKTKKYWRKNLKIQVSYLQSDYL
jgi:hypothetical protein